MAMPSTYFCLFQKSNQKAVSLQSQQHQHLPGNSELFLRLIGPVVHWMYLPSLKLDATSTHGTPEHDRYNVKVYFLHLNQYLLFFTSNHNFDI